MNARQMIARYAQGGMIDEVGELRANMGGEVSEARRMLQRFADGGEARQLFTDEATGESYFMVKGPDGRAYRSDRPIPGISQGLSPEEQAAYADSLRKSQEVTALGMLQRVDALRQQEEALSPNKMEWFDQAQRLMKEDPNYQMLQRQRPELFNPVSSAVQEAQGAYQTEQAAPASQQLWESKVYQQNYGQGNVLDSVYRDPTTGYGVVSLRDPKGFVERGIVDQKGNFLVGGDYRAQDLLEDAQRLSPKFSENISSLLESQGITPGVNDTFFDFQPYQQVTGEGTERTDTPFAEPVPTTTLLKDIPRTSPYQTQVDRMQELYENLSERLEGVKGEPGSPLTPGYTEKTDKTASQLLGDLDGVDQESSSVVLGSTTTSQPITLSPTTALPPPQGTFVPPPDLPPPTDIFVPPPDLPPLTDIFVPPTAPPPEAPPPALTAGQEGLDPSTAIVGATPVENRVARVTETAINKIPESERVTTPQLDTQFRASAPRTPTYDRFGRITGYNYSPAAKLTPATGTNVFNFVPPGITSRPRSLLNIGDVPGVMVDPVTGQMRLPLSASQQFARDRSTLDNQFRQLYARAAAGDKSLPAQAPTSAAAAFRDFVMSGEDPMLQNKLRFRDIEQQKYDPTKADPALRVQYGQSAFASDLAAAFDPFLARNRAALTSLAEQQTPKSYSEMYPDIAEAYAKLKPEDKAKFPTLRDYELYHFDTYGRKEGRTSPLLGMGALQSPYATAFFSKGGEASTEDFIKKQSGGDVSRGTASPETRGVTSVDEREEVRSEVQRMLKRAETLKSSRQEEEKSLGEKTIEAGLRLYDRFSDRAKMPVNQRVFLETVLDKSKEPITEASFSKKELDTLKSIILDRYKKIEPALDIYEKYLTEKLAGSNTKKRGTGFDKGVLYPEARKTYEKDLDAIRSYRQGTLTPEFVELADTTQNLRSRKMPYYRHYAFEDISVSGPDLFDKLNVSPVIGYDDYGIDAGKARRLFAGDDPRAALHTTLGRFRYKVDPETKGLVVVDRYDFNPPTAGHGGPSLPYRAAPGFLQAVTYPVEGAEPGGSSVGYDLVRTYAGRAAPEGSGRDVRIQLDNKQAPVPYNKGGEVSVPRETSTSKQQLDKLAQVSQRKKA